MNSYYCIHKKVITPLSDLITGWNINNNLKLLNESQFWSVDQIYAFQLERLKITSRFAFENSTFYKNYFIKYDFDPYKINEINDLKKLPVLSKDIVQQNLPEKISTITNTHKNTYIITATSGSTGKQLIYPITKQAYGLINSAAIRGWNWMGYNFGDKYIKISQNKRKSFLKKIQDKVNRSYLFAAQYNNAGFKDFIKLLDTVNPQFLRSYPDPLRFISNYIKDNNINIPGLQAINTTGNTLFKEDRILIEEVFGCEVFDSYSCEGSAQVFECETHKQYHVSDEYAISEIIDEKGQEVKPGEKGKLITTDLWNIACPFFRYDTNDWVIKGDPCSCNKNLSTIKSIIGRDNDIIICPNNNYFIAQNFTTYFKYFDSIKQFQVIQESPTDIEFIFEVKENLSTKDLMKINKYWSQKFSSNVSINISEKDKIFPRPSGKNQFIIRNF